MPEVVRRSGRLIATEAFPVMDKAESRAAVKSLEVAYSDTASSSEGTSILGSTLVKVMFF